MEHSISVNPFSYSTKEGWSLPAVKQALSHLRWQRDRLHHLHVGTSHGSDSPLAKTCSVVVDCAVEVFSANNDNEEPYLDRILIMQHMLIQQHRALVSINATTGCVYILYNNNYYVRIPIIHSLQRRRNALKRIVNFLSRTDSSDCILPSSKLTFLSTCLAHKVHYSVSLHLGV